jgi:Tol biopolymer transport system component
VCGGGWDTQEQCFPYSAIAITAFRKRGILPAELEKATNGILAAYLYAIIFKQSMEQRAIPIEVNFHNLTGDYFGQTPPGDTPQVFAPGIVSTDANEHSAPSFSPDGNEVFWWANRWPEEGPSMSMTMRRVNGQWSAPRVSPFGNMPAFSPDGRRVYFFAPRPGSDAAKDDESALDIWVAEKQGDGWSEPKCLNLVVRYPELRYADMPRVTRNGTLYFVGYAPDTKSNHGIYRTELINGEYAKPGLLPPSINLPSFINWAPFIAPDESYLLFSSNRAGSLDEYGDIYISRRQSDGSWTDPVSLGEPVNTNMQEVFPGVSPDGKYLFFCRYTPGHKNDVYWMNAASIPALRSNATPSQEKTK